MPYETAAGPAEESGYSSGHLLVTDLQQRLSHIIAPSAFAAPALSNPAKP